MRPEKSGALQPGGWQRRVLEKKTLADAESMVLTSAFRSTSRHGRANFSLHLPGLTLLHSLFLLARFCHHFSHGAHEADGPSYSSA